MPSRQINRIGTASLLKTWLMTSALVVFSLAADAGAQAVSQASSAAFSESSPPVNAESVVALVNQLGSESFADRELATRQLRGIGVSAFTLLRTYRDSDDPEIRQRVRSLLNELLPQMLRRGVPPVEASLTSDYLGLEELERRNRITLIAEYLMPEFGALAPLRIAQLETSDRLAKQASAAIVAGGFPTNDAQVDYFRTHLKVLSDDSVSDPHAGSEWIREFRRSLDHPEASIEAFQEFADDERVLLRHDPTATDEAVIIWPLRRYALDLRVKAGLEQEAAEYAAELFDWTEPESIARQRLLVWMLRREYDDLLITLGEDNDGWFKGHRFGQYLRAAAAERNGKATAAAELSDLAFAAAENEDNDRLDIARMLRTLSLNDWSEREYRAVFERSEAKIAPESFEARRMLAAMLNQQQRYSEAVEIMQAAVDFCEQDGTGRAEENLDQVPLGSATLPQFISDLHFLMAMQAGTEGDTEAQIENFRKAFAYSKENSDALCEAHQVKDQAWQAELSAIVDETVEALLEELSRYEIALMGRPHDDRIRGYIASRDNEISWILVNTGGNLNDALKHAQRSVEFRPGLSYSIDTLATCYFVLQQFDRAIEYERIALRLTPYREDIYRTLKRFEAGKASRD